VIQKEKDNKNKKMFTGKRIILSLVFLCLEFSFVGIRDAKADCTCKCINTPNTCQESVGSRANNAECSTFCQSYKSLELERGNCLKGTSFDAYNCEGLKTNSWNSQGSQLQSAAKSTSVGGAVDAVKDSVGGWILYAINAILYVVFKFVMALVYIMAVIFDWAVSAENFKTVMNMSAIKTGWTIVRDFLNIFFILILLFSAFCTIFQVEKYHIKKILLTLVLMALLVNFSFPIARTIIDAGNIPMYYFLKVIGGDGGSISKNLWNTTNGDGNQKGLEAIILPGITKAKEIEGNTDQTFGLLAAISFSFMFMITLAVMAILLVIRILVLAILVMFSPVGFTAAIFPSFSKYADDWWEQLFKQSFFGAIMAFMLYVALLVMKEAQTGVSSTLEAMAKKGTSGNLFDSVIIAGVTLVIPIILLWLGIIAAQKMGAAGAKEVGGQATKFAKWAGRLPWRGAKWAGKTGANATGVPGGIKQKYDNILSKFQSSRAQREAKIAGSGPFKVRGAELQDINKRSEEYKKNHVPEDELKNKAKAGDIAAAHRLAADGNMDVATYATVMPLIKDKKVKDMLDGKVKEKRVDVIMDYKIKTETEDRAIKLAGSSPVTDAHRNQAKIDIAQEEMGKVAPSKWKEQNVDELLGYNKDGTKKMDINSKARRIAVNKTFKSMSGKNREKVVDDMEPGKYAKGKKAGAWA
jgi:hypothetical protein